MTATTTKEKNMHYNQYGQPVGQPLPDWTERPFPEKKSIQGQYCTLEPLQADKHAPSLYRAYQHAPDGRDWTWLPIGPFKDFNDYFTHAKQFENSTDQVHYAIIDHKNQHAIGSIALIKIDTLNGSIEMGFVLYSPLLKKTVIATEAQFLLMQYVFDELKYRRYEWKCDHLNEPSRKAALRLGFNYEGTLRNLIVYKGRSRDTSWFSLLDHEWPANKAVLQSWLDPNNFDQNGQQIKPLQYFRTP